MRVFIAEHVALYGLNPKDSRQRFFRISDLARNTLTKFLTSQAIAKSCLIGHFCSKGDSEKLVYRVCISYV